MNTMEESDAEEEEVLENDVAEGEFDVEQDDPVAEGDEPTSPRLEPSEEKASSMKFHTLCMALESVWNAGVQRKQWSDVQKLWKILPPKFLQYLDNPSESGRPESVFPVLRLLLPEKDGSRQFQMAESTLGVMYGTALGFTVQSNKYRMLLRYSDPNSGLTKAQGLGDFSIVVQTVVGFTKVSSPNSGSGYTVGRINEALDMLASLPGKARQLKSNHDWKRDESSRSKPPTLKELRVRWLRQLNEGSSNCAGLSPLEHKWLVRIMLKKMQFGLGWKKLLQWYNPYAAMLWSAHNSLKGICNKICDPAFAEARHMIDIQKEDSDQQPKKGLSSYMPHSLVAPQFGQVFSPMLSERTGFARILDDISRRHREYLQSDAVRRLSLMLPPDCLALMHPAFCVESKLDGERFLVHFSRDGIVKMHTRRGNWYSELYSPVLGPAFRRAVRKGYDVILDGEVIAWDSVREETVPFGSNRTIAKFRKDSMARKGLLDPRDQGMHSDERDNNSVNSAKTFSDKAVDVEVGEECWLQFVAFDILYVNGPEAADLLSETVSDHIVPHPSPGPVIGLEAIERKKLLYKLLDPQPNEVEIVKTWIVRPNGLLDSGEGYFHPRSPSLECGYAAYKLDSVSFALSDTNHDIREIDAERRRDRSDDQISEARARAVQSLYEAMVEEQRLEGLVFKDLASPYYLGEESKSTRYWHKFKPDYFHESAASDLDVVVIGAYYATGLRNSGKPSSLLCACVDSEDAERFFPVCKVSLGSVDVSQATELLKVTGYQRDGEEDEPNSSRQNFWMRGNWDVKYFPDFISNRSFQPNNEDKGWQVQKKDYPDLWIHPNDSVVVTLNAGEIVLSDAFSAGISLRFPRITRIRQGADSKDVSDIESEEGLREKFWEVQNSRSRSVASAASVNLGSPNKSSISDTCRFFTERQYRESLKRKRVQSKKLKTVMHVPIPEPEIVMSSIFDGLSFAVLGSGGFEVKKGTIESDEAQEYGWSDKSHLFSGASALIQFIKQHGGKYKISVDHDCTFVLGGSTSDPKVVTYIAAIENARRQTDSLVHKSTTKKGQHLTKIGNSDGVVRWTFVVSLVYRWLSANHSTQESILATDPSFMTPTTLDYLVQPRSFKENDLFDKSLYECNITTARKMRQAIEIFNTGHDSSHSMGTSKLTNWRHCCFENLNESERWIAGCRVQVFWPYQKDSDEQPRLVLYPDMFESDFGLTKESAITPEIEELRWTQVSSNLTTNWFISVLPLVRVMGAFVTSHLHEGVTHVLCDLSVPHDEVVYNEGIDMLVFVDLERASRLCKRLQQLNSIRDHRIKLISPNWVRNQLSRIAVN